MQLISRKEAKALGLGRYYTGKPCKHGHICGRLASDRGCVECAVERRKANPEKHRERCKRYRETNPEKVREADKRYYEANREKHWEADKRWREANPEKAREKARKADKRYREANAEKRRTYAANYEANRRATDPMPTFGDRDYHCAGMTAFTSG